MRQESSFRCSNCRVILSSDPIGSKHRNHCPLCLWSKHVDLSTPGDRRSSCCAKMKPLAISFKDYSVNPFTNKGGGELVIIHKCLSCSSLSSNRIAGDDNEYEILCLIKDSINLSQEITKEIINLKLTPITNENKQESLISLLGLNYVHYISQLNIDI